MRILSRSRIDGEIYKINTMKKTFLIIISMCIAIILQAQIIKTVDLTTAGSLSTVLNASELSTVTDLTVTGLIDQRDFVTMRDNMPVLSVLNLTNTSVVAYGTYPANTIPDAAFTTMSGTTGKNTLTSVNLPSTVTTVGIGSFGHCYNLTSVIIPNSVTTISLASFVATGLTTINIPTSVTSIGQNAFLSCTSLTSVIIPSSVTSIGSQAFAYCDVLTSVKVYSNTPIDLSSSANVFSNSNLANCILYVLPASKSLYSAANQWSAFSAILDLPEYVTITNTAGNLSTALTANQLKSAISLTVSGTIDARDFLTIRDKMPLLTALNIGLASVVAYTGTEGTDKSATSTGIYLANTIPIDAFYSKTSLLSVTLPTTITKIDDYAFNFCIGISSLTIPASVTTFGIRAFNLCSGLTSINIPSSVTLLNDALFCGCTKLSSITIPSSITAIGAYTFYNCSGFNAITIPTSVKTIGSQAFFGCSGLSTIVIPSSVTAISDFTFSSCTGLKTVTIPTSVTSIGVQAFSGCSGLTTFFIPPSVTAISNYTFINCTGLKSVTIPTSITSIGFEAFELCSSLLSVTIPSSVTTIGANAFASCTSLNSITVNSTAPIDLSNSTTVFNNVNKSTCILNVPAGTKSAYSTANQWKDFINIVSPFELSSKTATIAQNVGCAALIAVTSSLTWTASTTASWLSVSPSVATIGNGTIILTATSLNVSAPRTTTVTITAPGMTSQIITVTQTTDGGYIGGQLSVDLDKTANSSSTSIVGANTTWIASTTTPWLSVSPTTTVSGNGSITITTTAENPTILARTGTVVLTPAGGSPLNITVNQAAGTPVVTLASNSVNIAKTAASTTLISVKSNTTWTANTTASWLTLNPAIATTGDAVLNITANTSNPTIIPRIATVTVTAKGVSSQNITVTQAAGDTILMLAANTASFTKNNTSPVAISVTSNTTWTANTTASWLTINPLTATTGNATLTINANSNNPNTTARTATISVLANGKAPQTITVTQDAGDAWYSITPDVLSFDKTTNSRTVTISSNTYWSTFSPSTFTWYNVSPTSGGIGTTTVTITASANQTISERKTPVVIIGTGITTNSAILLTQAAGDPTIALSSNTANIAKTENSKATISVTSNTSWTAVTTDSWILLNPSATFTGNGSLEISAKNANPTISPRTATVKVYTLGLSTPELITVTQAAGDTILSVSANTASFTKNNTIPVTISVTSNTTWLAHTTASWLTINPSTVTTGNATLTINANSDNPNTTARTATIIVLANGIATQTITVTQDAGDAWYSITPDVLSFDKTTNSRTVTISSNTYWSTLSPSTFTWYNVSPTSGGIGTTTVTITASANQTISERNTPVVIIGTGITTNSAILLTQAAGDPTIVLSSNNANIAKTENSKATISVTSNTSWTAETTDSWILLNPSATFTGNGSLEISAKNANPTISPRTATVKVYTLGLSTPELITVTQAAGDTILTVSSKTFEALGGGSIFSVTVTSNTTWTASTKDSRVKILEPSTNTGTKVLSFGIDTNPYTTQDGGTITISAVGAADQVLLISQYPGPITFLIDKPALTFAAKKDTSSTVNVLSNTSDWTAISTDNWLSVTPYSNSFGSEIIIAATENKTTISRTATIIINAIGAIDKTITVTQEAGYPTLSVSNLKTKFSAKVDSISISVTSNTKWSVNSNDNWITISAPIDSSNATVKLYSLANTTTEPRTAAISFTSDGLNPVTIVVEQVADTVLNVSEIAATIASKTDTTKAIDVTSNTNWTATSNESWLTVTPKSSSFDSQIIIAASENKTTITRTGTIIVSAIGAGSRTITITQEAGEPTLSVSNLKSIFSTKIDTISVSVTSNTKWTVSTIDNWVTISAAIDSSNAIVKLYSVANSTIVPRTATIIFSAVGINPESITVYQSADTVLTVSKTATIISSKTDTTSSIDVTSNTAWTVKSSDSWLTTSKLLGNSNETIVLFATQNSTILSRSATITVKAIGSQDKIVTVTQLAGDTVLTISKNTFAVQSNIDTILVNITSNATWTALAPQSWVSISPSNKTGNGVLQIIIAKNNSVLSRTANITISINGAKEQIISIIQSAGVPVISAASIANIGETANSTITIPVTSNTDWNAITLVDWLTITQSTPTGDGTLIITALANPTNAPRTAKILLSGIGALSQAITVTQAAGTGTLVYDIEKNANIIYPNPASSTFFINTTSNADVLVYTTTGTLVLHKNVSAGEQISIENLPVGMYQVIINTENGISQQKLIKE